MDTLKQIDSGDYVEVRHSRIYREFLEITEDKDPIIAPKAGATLQSIIEGIAPSLAKSKDYVNSMISDFVEMKSFFIPAALIGYEHMFEKYTLEVGTMYVRDSIVFLAAHVVFGLYDEKARTWEKMNLNFPLGVVTSHVKIAELDSLNYVCDKGIYPHEVDGPVLNYIVRKYDGLPIIVASAIGEKKGCVVLSCGIAKYYDLDLGPLIFEKVGLTGYVRHGYYENVRVPSINVGGSEIRLVESIPLTPMEFSLLEPSMDVDGVIVSLNYVEKKVKFFNSVELRYDKGQLLDGDGRMYPTGLTLETSGIYECQVMKGIVVTAKWRGDKHFPQKKIKDILDSPTVSDLQFKLKKVDFLSDICIDYLGLHDACNVIRDEIEKKKIGMLTVMTVKSILKSRRFHADYHPVMNKLSPGASFIKSDKIDYSVVNAPGKMAGTNDIFNRLRTSGVCLPIHEMAINCAKKNMSVGAKRIWLMTIREQIRVSGESIFVGKSQTFKRHSEGDGYRVITDPIEGVKRYAEYARMDKHAAETALSGLLSELSELEIDFHEAGVNTNEVGDVTVMLLRVIDTRYPGIRIFEDKVVLQDVLGHQIFDEFKKKMRDRLMKFGCVRNHFSAGSHRCVCGNHFTRDDAKPVASQFSRLPEDIWPRRSVVVKEEKVEPKVESSELVQEIEKWIKDGGKWLSIPRETRLMLGKGGESAVSWWKDFTLPRQ